MQHAYILDALRTPIGKFSGSLSTVRPDDLLGMVLKGLMARNEKVDVNAIEDVIAGCANQAGEDNRDVARMALLLAGLPISVGGNTVNRLCASGLQAIMDASRALRCGDGDLMIACGVESMTRAPFVMGKNDTPFARKVDIFDTSIGWRFINPALSALHHPYSMGETAENVAERWNISRQAQDEFAYNSQLKYDKAHQQHRFADELMSVEVSLGKGKTMMFEKDEHPRLSPIEKLAELKPAFKKDGTVTAGNASGINDGAAALLLANDEAVKRYDVQPMAIVRSMAVAGVDPAVMGIGPVPATKKALQRAGLSMNDIGLVELNEAFASQSLACMQELNIDPSIVNVNGGAIALGHPLGCSGARISTTLLHEMRKRKVRYGLATMCIGVGQGAAIVYENLDL
ncbi:MAG: acetyl-CoA C-acyltransferase [Chitinophagaceae bacterium]|nr:acetyl-CoA C-acyltransferase [Chitinophagaceae bacterium]